jgi:hypothetical protein
MEPPKASRNKGLIGWLPLVVLPLSALALYNLLQPWAFMWILTASIYCGLKWLTWFKGRGRVPHAAWRSIAYLVAWPGMDADSFLDARKVAVPPRLRDWLHAVLETGLGAILLWAVARILPPGQTLLRGWIGMLGLILLLHFGSFQILALFWQRFAVTATPIMSAPLRSGSLSEFWGKRWNLGFRQLSYDLIFAPLHRKLGATLTTLLVFVVSGLIHDLVISVPARGDYGFPTAYFTLQGVGVAFERSRSGERLGLGTGIRGWLFMVVVTAGPVFWLFHPPFVMHVIIPFMKAIHAL